MGRREIIRELATLARNPKISFEKGLIKTLNNDKLGFVSELNNMEINENGVLMRRRGTRLISDPTDPHKFHFIESAFINGVEFIFGLDYRRVLYCWLEFWPELTMSVYDQSFLKKMTENTVLGSVATNLLSFQRGSKFWFNDFENHIDIINNYGDAYRIEKQGFVRIAKRVYEPYDRDIILDMLNARNGATTDIACYMDVKNISNKDFPKDDVNFIDCKNSDFENIKGSLQFARINEAGIMSTLSDRYTLPEYRQGYISMVDGVSVSKNNELEVSFDDVITSGATSEAGVAYARNETGKFFSGEPQIKVDTSFSDISQTYNTKEAKLIIPHIDSRDDKTFYMQLADGAAVETREYWEGLPKDKVYLIFPHVEGDGPVTELSSSDIGKFIKLKNVRFQTNKMNMIGDIDCRIVDKYIAFSPDWSSPDPAEISNNVVTLDYEYEGGDGRPDGHEGYLYELDIDPESLLTEYVYRIKWSDAKYDDNILCLSFTKPGYFSGLYECDLVINSDYSAADANKYSCYEYTYKYKSDYLYDDILMIGLQEKGFDCWEVISKNNYLRSLCVLINSSNKKLIVDADNVDVFLEQDGFYNFMQNGFRFAVTKDEKIISKSQRCIADRNTKEPIYYYVDDRVVGADNYGTVPPAGFKGEIMYLPITSIRNLFTRSEAFRKQEIADIVRDPKDIVINNSSVFVLQGNQIWSGNSNWIMDKVREINTGVFDIERFHAGILIATNSGLFYYKDSMRKVVNGDNIKASIAKSVKSGVVVIDRTGDIYLVRMQYTNGAQYPIAEKISHIINEQVFSPTSKVASVDDTIYIATDKTIWGFSVGQSPRWDKKYEFDKNIDMLSNFDNRLLIVFTQNTDKLDLFTLPETGSGVS